jgi:hypothetical protein
MKFEVLMGSKMLCLPVVIKVITVHKPYATNITFKWSLPCMYILMLRQKISGIKSLITNKTLHYILTKVPFLVNFQVTFVVSGIITNVTGMILLFPMDISLMFINLALTFECFVTHITNKWPLLTVGGNVTL